jgi:hypothetical protein
MNQRAFSFSVINFFILNKYKVGYVQNIFIYIKVNSTINLNVNNMFWVKNYKSVWINSNQSQPNISKHILDV